MGKLTTKYAKQNPSWENQSLLTAAKYSLSFITEDYSDIPSQPPNTDLYIPVSCLQQSGTDRYTEAQTCSPQIQHKEYSENILVKENLVWRKN